MNRLMYHRLGAMVQYTMKTSFVSGKQTRVALGNAVWLFEILHVFECWSIQYSHYSSFIYFKFDKNHLRLQVKCKI